MNWQISLLFFFASTVSNTIWSRVYTQKTKLSAKVAPAIGYILGVMPLGIVVGVASRNTSVDWSSKLVSLLVLEGLFIGLFNWISFAAWKKVTVAQFQTIFQIYAITATVIGWIFLNENLSRSQLLGSALLIVGALIAANSHTGKKKKIVWSLRSGASLTAISAVCLGIGLVAEKAALSHTSLGAYFIFGFAAQTIALIIIAFKDFKLLNIKQISKYDLRGAMLIGIFSALTGFFYIYSLKHANNIGLVTMASTFQLPLSVLAGYLILKERDSVGRLTIACLIAFSGLLINTLS